MAVFHIGLLCVLSFGYPHLLLSSFSLPPCLEITTPQEGPSIDSHVRFVQLSPLPKAYFCSLPVMGTF